MDKKYQEYLAKQVANHKLYSDGYKSPASGKAITERLAKGDDVRIMGYSLSTMIAYDITATPSEYDGKSVTIYTATPVPEYGTHNLHTLRFNSSASALLRDLRIGANAYRFITK